MCSEKTKQVGYRDSEHLEPAERFIWERTCSGSESFLSPACFVPVKLQFHNNYLVVFL